MKYQKRWKLKAVRWRTIEERIDGFSEGNNILKCSGRFSMNTSWFTKTKKAKNLCFVWICRRTKDRSWRTVKKPAPLKSPTKIRLTTYVVVCKRRFLVFTEFLVYSPWREGYGAVVESNQQAWLRGRVSDFISCLIIAGWRHSLLDVCAHVPL